MSERLKRPGTPWSEQPGGNAFAGPLKRAPLALLALTGIAAAPLAATAFWEMPIMLVWNVSASAPVGLYKLEHRAAVRSGDMVAAWIPRHARSLAASRDYLPANVPLVKRVAAAQGDRVCAREAVIRINGRHAASRLKRDSSGRPMPWWTGCRTLRAGEYFLLMDSRRSFDGRYFGPTRAHELIARAVLLWAR